MSIKATATITISRINDVVAVYRYYIRTTSMNTPVIDMPYTRPPSTSGVLWDDTEPDYEGGTYYLYFTDCTVLSNGSLQYSTVSLSSSYEAAKAAYNLADNANTVAANASDTANSAKVSVDGVRQYSDGTHDVYMNNDGTYYYVDDDGNVQNIDYNNLLDDDGNQVGISGKEPRYELDGSLANGFDTNSKDIDDLQTKLGDMDDRVSSIIDEYISKELIASGNAINDDGTIYIFNKDANGQIKSQLALQPTVIEMLVGAASAFRVETLSGEGIISANSAQLSTLRMRSADNRGTFGWVAQSNGHISLKEVL